MRGVARIGLGCVDNCAEVVTRYRLGMRGQRGSAWDACTSSDHRPGMRASWGLSAGRDGENVGLGCASPILYGRTTLNIGLRCVDKHSRVVPGGLRHAENGRLSKLLLKWPLSVYRAKVRLLPKAVACLRCGPTWAYRPGMRTAGNKVVRGGTQRDRPGMRPRHP